MGFFIFLKLIILTTIVTSVRTLPVLDQSNITDSNVSQVLAGEIPLTKVEEEIVHVKEETQKVEKNVDEKIIAKVENVADNKAVADDEISSPLTTKEIEVISKPKHTPPPECHGDRKEADPAAAEEYKAKKHTKPTKGKQTTAVEVTESTKRSTRRHGVKFDENGDSVWVDDSNDSPDSSDERLKKKEGKLDTDGNMIDAENQASGERNSGSEDESDETDGIPIITIPLVDILNKYARMMGGKRASNSRYEYSYEDENEIKIKEIKERILDEASQADEDDL